MNLNAIINDPNATIVDVREPFEVFFGKAKGAINIPLSKLPSQIDQFRDMNGPIVLYCRSGNRSGQAAEFLKANGFKQVYNAGSVEEVRQYQKKAA